MKNRLKVLILYVITPLIIGCAGFHPNPISASEVGLALEARTLDNPGLKKFIEANLHHEVTPWPPKSWDFQMLTLAALYFDPHLDVARAEWEGAEAGIITAGERPNPSLNFTSEYNTTATSGVPPWILSPTIDIPIETPGKRGNRVAQAKFASEAARLQIANVAWQVRSRLRTGLLDLYSATQTEPFLKSQLATQEEIVKLLERRFSVGDASRVEVTQERISLGQIRLSMPEAQKQYAEARMKLAESLGLLPTALDGVDLSFGFVEGYSSPTDDSFKDIRHQALSRPDMLSALAEYSASQSSLQLEIAKQYPDIQLGPGYSWDAGDRKWSLGLTVSLPVFNHNRGAVAEAEARRKAVATRFALLQIQAIGEVDRAMAGFQSSVQKLEVADSILSSMETQLQSGEAMFKSGEADRLALLSAQFEYYVAAISRLEALVKVQESLGLLEDAVKRPLTPSEVFPAASETNPRGKDENNK